MSTGLILFIGRHGHDVHEIMARTELSDPDVRAA